MQSTPWLCDARFFKESRIDNATVVTSHSNCCYYSEIHDTCSFERNSDICDQLVTVLEFKRVVSYSTFVEHFQNHMRAMTPRWVWIFIDLVLKIYNFDLPVILITFTDTSLTTILTCFLLRKFLRSTPREIKSTIRQDPGTVQSTSCPDNLCILMLSFLVHLKSGRIARYFPASVFRVECLFAVYLTTVSVAQTNSAK